ncbi:MAG: hypothetical protein ACFCUM_14070 [Bacteroidales bacterium]
MKKIIILTAALATAFLFSCQKDPQEKSLTEEEQAIIMDDAVADNVIEATDYEVDYYSSSSDIIKGINNGGTKSSFWPRGRYHNGLGPAVTVNPVGWHFPKTITIDYGDGIQLVNGSIIMGKIIVNVTARPLTDGAAHEVTYENFFVDSVNIAGGATHTFVGTDSTERVFSSLSDLTLTFPDCTVIDRYSERIRTLAEGFETPFYHGDDLILIEGFVNYRFSNGRSFIKTIIKPLTKTGACRFITSGTVTFTLNGEEFAELDYGDGTCDDVATITKNGETRRITIGRRLKKFWAR